MFKSNKQNFEIEKTLIEKLKCSSKEEDFFEITINEHILKEEILSNFIQDCSFYNEYTNLSFIKNNYILKKNLDGIKMKLNASINEFECVLANKNNKISSLNSELKKYINSTNKLNDENHILNQNLDNIKKKLNSSTNEFECVLANKNNEISLLDSKLKKYINSTNKLKKENQTLNKNLNSIKEELKSLKDNSNLLTKKNTSLQTKNKNFKKSLDKRYFNNNKLEKDCNSLSSENISLKNKLDNLTHEIEVCQANELELNILKSNSKDLFDLEKKLNHLFISKIEKERDMFLKRSKELSAKNDKINYYTKIITKYKHDLSYDLLDKLLAAEAIRTLINKEAITDYSAGLSLYAGILEYMLSECIPKKCILEFKIETIADKLNFLTKNSVNLEQWKYFLKELYKYEIIFLRNKAQHGEFITRNEYNKFIDFLFSSDISNIYESNNRFEFILHNLKYM